MRSHKVSSKSKHAWPPLSFTAPGRGGTPSPAALHFPPGVLAAAAAVPAVHGVGALLVLCKLPAVPVLAAALGGITAADAGAGVLAPGRTGAAAMAPAAAAIWPPHSCPGGACASYVAGARLVINGTAQQLGHAACLGGGILHAITSSVC